MKKNKISKYILFVCFLSLFVVLVLIIQKSYSNFLGQSAKVDASPGKPINPNLNTTIIDEIVRREILTISPISSPSTELSSPISP
ncbi:MAG: hypothetical protein WCV93_04935 [Candidatus Shapirobacteria bacterium]